MGAFYLANEYWFAVFQLVTAMLGMGATLTPKDFREIATEPFPVLSGVSLQLIVVPLLAFLMITLLNVSAGVAVGVALIAAVPGGSSSNIFTLFAKGNVALSISITAITTIICLVSTPLILELLVSPYLPETFVMPTLEIMQDISVNLLLPLAVGMVCLRFSPKLASWLSTWCIRASVLGLLMIFVGASLAGRLDAEAFGFNNILLVSGFVFLLMLAGWLIPRMLGIGRADASAIEMEVLVRNINLGVMLNVLLFPVVEGQDNTLGNMSLFALLLYGGVQLILAVLIVPFKRKKHAPELAA